MKLDLTRMFIISLLLCASGFCGTIRLTGSDFKGADSFRHIFNGIQNIAFVYPAESKRSVLSYKFDIDDISGGCRIYINGKFYKTEIRPDIQFSVNDRVVYSGSSLFENDVWKWEEFQIQSDWLKPNANTLEIKNLKPNGQLGEDGCFMISQCVISDKPLDPQIASVDPLKQFSFKFDYEDNSPSCPAEMKTQNLRYQFRGLKGWNFSTDDYLEIIPFMVENKMNFLMNCYLSTFTRTQRMQTFENCLIPYDNNWWQEFDHTQKQGYEKIVQACKQNNIIFCFSMNPNYNSTRVFDYKDENDFNSLLANFLWAQSIGVQWFNVSFDDIKQGIDAQGQAQSVAKLLNILREKDPSAQMIFCPTYYHGIYNDKDKPEIIKEYLRTLDKYLPQDVYIFWTGPGENRTVTKELALEYKNAINRRLFFWDNYPVNNGANTIHLGPLIGRDAEIAAIADGYISNPMWPQVSINKLPLMTAADYAFDPQGYCPAASIAAAIEKLTQNKRQAQAIRELVYLYIGKIYHNRQSVYNPFVDKFNQITQIEHSRFIAQAYITHSEKVLEELKLQFNDGLFADGIQRLAADIEAIKKTYYLVYGIEYTV